MKTWVPVAACALILTVRVGIPQAPPKAPPALTGTVVSAEDGSPLKDAIVEAFARHDTRTQREKRAAGSFAEDPVATARTDGRGAFRMEVPPGARVVVSARAASRASARVASLMTPPAGTPPRDIGRVELERGRRLEGKVLGPGGAPVAGARVSALPPQGGRAPMGPLLRASGGRAAAPPPVTATTGKDGSFALDSLPESLVRLHLHAAGFAPEFLPEPRRSGPLTLRLSAGHTVTGRVVTPAGAPAAGTWVLAGEDGLEGTARCDAQGRFRFERLAAGTRVLVATGDDILVPVGAEEAPRPAASWAPSASLRLTLPIAPDSPEPRLTLRPGSIVRARAVDAATRAPFPGVLLALEEAGDTAPRSALAAERGEAVFTGVPAGGVTLLGSADGYLDEVEGPRTVRAGQTAEITLALTEAAALEGTVRDTAGRAVGGARVSLTIGPLTPLPIPVPLRIPFGEPVRTDEQGRYAFERLPARRPLRVAVEQEGFVPWEATDIRLRAGERRTGLDAWLDAGLLLTGRVLDKEGRPVAAAAVTATRAEDESPMGGRMVIRMAAGGPGGRGRATSLGAGEALPETLAGDDGVFRVRGARPGVWSIEVRARGFAPAGVAGLKLDEGARTLDAGDITLEKGAALKGRVVDAAGEAIPFARGTARREMESLADTIAGPDGAFVIEDLTPAAPVTLAFTAEGFGEKEMPGLAPPLDGLTITLPASSRLSGSVVDQESRRPVADFSISTGRGRSVGGGGFSQMSMSVGPEKVFHDEDGAFMIDGIAPGKVDLTVRAPGYREAALRDIPVPEGKDVDGLLVTLERAVSVSGVVVDDGGRPLPGVSVKRSEGSGQGGFVVRLGAGARDGNQTDGEGRFVVDGLEPGPVTLSFTHPEFEPAERDVDASREVAGLRVALARGASLTGIVVREEDGSPVAAATVLAQAAGSAAFGGALSARTGPDGAFQIDAVRPGRYMLSASATGLRPAQGPQEVVVSPGAPLPPVELRLGGGVHLTGQITGVKAEELPRMSVGAFTPGTAGFGASAAVDASGRFEMKGLPHGTVHLRAGSSLMEGRSAVRTVQIPEGVATFETTIEFPRGRRVEGLVTRGGEPMDGATVLFALESARTSASATTDAAGRYAVEDLDEGEYAVNVMHFGSGQSHSTRVTVSSDRTFDIELPTHRLSGTVLDAGSGRPLEHATLALEPEGGRRDGMLVFRNQGRTDATGAFVFDGLGDGVWTITARREGYAVESRTVRIVPSADPEPIVFELTRADGLLLRAVDARSHLPLTRIAALVTPAGGGDPLAGAPGTVLFQGQISADASGLFHLDSLGPGVYTVVLGGHGLATRTLRTVKVPAPEIALSMETGGEVEAACEGLAPSQSARGVLLDAEGLPVHWQTFSADPTFLLRPGSPTMVRDLPAGSYTLRAALPDGKVAEKRVTVVAGSTARVSLP